jgi:uncharacterized protein (DUF1499 family)
MIASQPRVKLLSKHRQGKKLIYVQQSLIMGYPDFINVLFIKVDEQRSTIAIFSQSYFGYSDLGVNKQRVLAWLEQLKHTK